MPTLSPSRRRACALRLPWLVMGDLGGQRCLSLAFSRRPRATKTRRRHARGVDAGIVDDADPYWFQRLDCSPPGSAAPRLSRRASGGSSGRPEDAPHIAAGGAAAGTPLFVATTATPIFSALRGTRALAVCKPGHQGERES
jgi:hypothetical protein